MAICFCGSEKEYSACCEPFILGKEYPKSAEQLLRSRYTAYVVKNSKYIMQTAIGPASRDFKESDAKDWMEHVSWEELTILDSRQISNGSCAIEFMVRFNVHGKPNVLHEIGEFRKQDGKWFYFDGKYPKTGRNDPCFCQSGKKFKKCCGLTISN